MEVQAKISRIRIERCISFLKSSFGLVLPFLSVSPLIWRTGVEKELVSTPVTHPPQRGPMLGDCYILPEERNGDFILNSVSFYLWVPVSSTTGPTVQYISPTPKVEYVKIQITFIIS